MGFVTDVGYEKEVKVFTTTDSGTFDIILTNRALLITDIIISKDSDTRTTLRINDGINDVPFLFTNKDKEISSENGLLFWNGGNLQVTTNGGINMITVGYHPITGDNYEKWRL